MIIKMRKEIQQDFLQEVLRVVGELNEEFRKNNTYVKVCPDEFNDLWEEKLNERLRKL